MLNSKAGVQKMGKDEIIESCGNLYADLNYKNAEEMQTKAELAHEIYLIIQRKKLTQSKAAKLLRLTQPKVSNLVNGRLSGFSIERLINFLNILDYDVKITLKKKPKNRKQAHTFISHERQQPVPIAAKNH